MRYKKMISKIEINSDVVAYFKDNSLVISNDANSTMQVDVFNSIGQSLVSYKNVENKKEVLVQSNSFSTKQLFIVVVTDNLGNRKSGSRRIISSHIASHIPNLSSDIKWIRCSSPLR